MPRIRGGRLGASNHGRAFPVGAAAKTLVTPISSAVSFTGGYGIVTDSANLRGFSSLSVEFWYVRAPADNHPYVAYHPSASAGNWYIGADGAATQHPLVALQTTGGEITHTFSTLTFSNDGAWHYCAFTFDGSNWVCRLDDTTETAVDARTLQLTGAVNLGFAAYSAGDYTRNVGLDEVRIWSVARAQSDLTLYRYRQLYGTESGLAGYWRFNEGSGTSAADIVNSNTCNLSGLYAWVVPPGGPPTAP